MLKRPKNFIALATDWKGNRNGCKMCQGTQQKEATGDQPKKSSLEFSKFLKIDLRSGLGCGALSVNGLV